MPVRPFLWISLDLESSFLLKYCGWLLNSPSHLDSGMSVFLAQLHFGASGILFCCLFRRLFCCLFRKHQLELYAVFVRERALLRISLLTYNCFLYLVKNRSPTFTVELVGIWRTGVYILQNFRSFFQFVEVTCSPCVVH